MKNIIKRLLKYIYKFFWIFPIKKNKIIVSSFSARSFSDNPKYILLDLIENYGNCLEYFLVLRKSANKEHIPECVHIVEYNTLSYLYHMATSKIWIDNTRKQSFLSKRKKQIYIQTWHGSIPFKKIERDIQSILTKEYIETAKKDSSMIDYLILNSVWSKNLFLKMFWYNGTVKLLGTARLDLLLNNPIKLKQLAINNIGLSVCDGTHYILYAPTFRDNGNTNVYDLDFDKLIDVIQSKFGGKWLVLVHLHPNISSNIQIKEKTSVIDVSEYSDVIELFALADLLITDYSSVMFEFSLQRKPVFLYMPDYESYMMARGSYFLMSEIPFLSARNQHDLYDNIKKFDWNTYLQLLNNFFISLDINEDGNSLNRIRNLIMKCFEE